jgi:hypothetical protein
VSHAAPDYDEADDDNDEGDAPIFGAQRAHEFHIDFSKLN